MKKIRVELIIINNHFYDNAMFMKVNNEMFKDAASLAEELGVEYMDFDIDLWSDNVEFIFDGKVVETSEAFDMMMY